MLPVIWTRDASVRVVTNMASQSRNGIPKNGDNEMRAAQNLGRRIMITSQLGIPKRDEVAFVLVDIQERFLPVIYSIETVINNANRLVRGASILKIPLVVTEQYPKGLGHTVDEISLDEGQEIIEKISFDCFGCDDFVRKLAGLEVKSLVVFGIEAHVCVLKTGTARPCRSPAGGWTR